MRPIYEKSWPVLVVFILASGGFLMMSGTDQQASAEPKSVVLAEGMQQATFGAGCFWCVEAVFRELEGVQAVVSGYSGGQPNRVTYREISSGTTGHAEVIQIIFDPKIVSFAKLLEVFWQVHNPTTLNQQGADRGTQYRSVIFFHSEEQHQQARVYKKKLDASGAFSDPIVTEISPFDRFFSAESEHQNYYARNQTQGYCRMVIQPKLEKFRKVFAKNLKASTPQKTGEPASAVGPPEPKIDWTKIDWKKRLTKEQYHVTRKHGTERARTGKYWDNNRDGTYHCICCGLSLFASETKYKSGTGWPSFFQPIEKKHVTEFEDRSLLGGVRIETRCSRCDAHLGHVFSDGPQPTGLRYCMNSAALDFKEAPVESDQAPVVKP